MRSIFRTVSLRRLLDVREKEQCSAGCHLLFVLHAESWTWLDHMTTLPGTGTPSKYDLPSQPNECELFKCSGIADQISYLSIYKQTATSTCLIPFTMDSH